MQCKRRGCPARADEVSAAGRAGPRDMASAGVKAVRELRDEEPPGELLSRSVPALNGAAHLDDDDDNSVARRL